MSTALCTTALHWRIALKTYCTLLHQTAVLLCHCRELQHIAPWCTVYFCTNKVHRTYILICLPMSVHCCCLCTVGLFCCVDLVDPSADGHIGASEGKSLVGAHLPLATPLASGWLGGPLCPPCNVYTTSLPYIQRCWHRTVRSGGSLGVICPHISILSALYPHPSFNLLHIKCTSLQQDHPITMKASASLFSSSLMIRTSCSHKPSTKTPQTACLKTRYMKHHRLHPWQILLDQGVNISKWLTPPSDDRATLPPPWTGIPRRVVSSYPRRRHVILTK